MAILRGPYGTSQIKGSIGAVCFQAGPYGLTVRSRTVPVNPNTTRQNVARNALDVASLQWKVLSTDPAFQNSWVNYALGTTWLNHLGDPIHLSARTHFIRNYSFQLGGGVALADVITDAPLSPGVPPADGIPADTDTTLGISINDQNPPLATGDLMKIGLFGPTLPSINYHTNPYTIVNYFTDAITFPFEMVAPAAVEIGQRWFLITRIYRAGFGLSTDLRGSFDILA